MINYYFTEYKLNFIVALLFCFSHSAFSEEVALLNLEFKRLATEKTFPKQDIPCDVVVNKPKDIRFNQDNLGAVNAGEPAVTDLPVAYWLHTSLMRMDTVGIKTSKSDVTGNGIELSTRLKKLYVWSHGMRLYATIAIDAKIHQKSTGAEVLKRYRIAGSKLNWAGTDSEFSTTVNISVNRLIEQISLDIAHTCDSNQE